MPSICVYCGSKSGTQPSYLNIATQFGKALALNNFNLVYGGANIGLMGAIANSVLNNNGKAIGVIPKVIFDFEVAHEKLTELHRVDSMHERKLKMMQLSDAFIALPGGFGTMDELNEIITWRQIKLHDKPIFILNHDGFFDDYISFIKRAVKEGFISQTHLDMLTITSTVEDTFNKLNKIFN